ncbi:hypothetical protein N7453_005284 [Penicillium expansum]|nr:hypothetical protein N7453_005284 [Penicillium expansum]
MKIKVNLRTVISQSKIGLLALAMDRYERSFNKSFLQELFEFKHYGIYYVLLPARSIIPSEASVEL